jgi:predicted O-methyltransferase YrrM
MIKNITLEEFKREYGWVEYQERLHFSEASYNIILTLIKKYSPNNIFEIGTEYGAGTTLMAIYSSINTKIWTLDITPLGNKLLELAEQKLDTEGICFKNIPEIHKITPIICNSYEFNPTSLPKMDFIFIDGDHSYDAVKNDTILALKMINSGGIILWHDTSLSEIKKYLDEISNEFDIINPECCMFMVVK